ncbi:hypothetical protein DERP_001081 [Dermatophagoides pteronyssinus]|uniref:Cyclin-dependent kinase inhibitor domain-containing protein n=1 Tax=Dermatophagoides pteronyssinus TaxID=6956 RepID=A0ABQ8JDF6_DERPT|nr:hypothetical protein DERP_001081 [Dermatophagoides pteronyssinus]
MPTAATTSAADIAGTSHQIRTTFTETTAASSSHHIETRQLQSVRRRLFQTAASSTTETSSTDWLAEQIEQIQRQQRERYNFDFERGSPLPDSPGHRFRWEPVIQQQPIESSIQSTSKTKSSGGLTIPTTSMTKQTSLMGMLPVRCKARSLSTITTTTSSSSKAATAKSIDIGEYESKQKRPISTVESSEEESKHSEYSKMLKIKHPRLEQTSSKDDDDDPKSKINIFPIL